MVQFSNVLLAIDKGHTVPGSALPLRRQNTNCAVSAGSNHCGQAIGTILRTYNENL